MKKAMWIISMLSLIMTAVVLQIMPNSVPMHYNMAGEIDRWGSKYENLIFPGLILALSLFWHLFISYYERKANKSTDEKESAEARSNAKMMKIVGVATAAMHTVMHGFLLYGSYTEAITDATHSAIDIGKVSCILGGILFVVLGNFMPKSKKNHVAGVRISWSMYNDTTWRKSNRFGAVAMMIAGLFTIVTTVFVKAIMALIMMIVYLLAATTIVLLYAHMVYKQELAKEGQSNLNSDGF